jgi:recombination protein RecR
MQSRFAEPMSRLIEELRKLPGIGTKSAQRLAFHILRSSAEDARALAVAIQELKQHLRLCSVCNNITDVDPCSYCTSPTRDHRLVCVLEEPTNIASIEKTRSYNGVYHILHGTLSPVNGVGPEQLRIANLLTRVLAAPAVSRDRVAFPAYPDNPDAEPAGPANAPALEGIGIAEDVGIEEVILATSPTTEGEATAAYLAHELRRARPDLRITRIATGVPAGSDIEYADEVTMTRAMEGRRAL